MWGFIPEASILFHWPISVFIPVHYYFDYYNFVIKFGIRNCDVSSLFFFSGWLWLSGVFSCFMQILGFFFFLYFCETHHWNFEGIAPNLWMALSTTDILTILILKIPVHGLSFHLFVSSWISFINKPIFHFLG